MSATKTVVHLCVIGIVTMLTTNAFGVLDPEEALGVWFFDERDGDTIFDSSGHDFEGVLNNGVEWTDGKFEGAILCDGVDDFVEMIDPINVELEQAAHAISLWANPGEKDQPAHADILGNHTGDFKGYDIEQRVSEQNTFYHGMGIGGAWAGGAPAARPATTLEIGVWQHYVVQKDGSTVGHYLNGEMTVEYEVGDELVSPSLAKLRLCLSQCCAGRNWNGAIDELIVFPRAFTEDEIKALGRGLEQAFAVNPKDKVTTTWGELRRAY